MIERLRSFVAALRPRRAIENEFDDELRDHIERDIAHRVRSGADPAAARRAALARFGGIERTKDDIRDAHGITMLDNFGRDVRLALRRVARYPRYTLLVTATIGLGIGAATAVFSAVDGVLLRPLPYPEPERLVTLWQTRPADGVDRIDFAPANFFDVRERAQTLAGVAAANPWSVNLSVPGSTEQVEAWQLSRDFLSLIGVTPYFGRAFMTADFNPGAEPVALLDHGFWMRRFGGDRSIVGRVLTLDERSVTVIGVMPPGFDLPEPTSMWMPWAPGEEERAERFATYIRVYGRLAPGATPDAARAELAETGKALEREYARSNAGYGFALVPLHEYLVGASRPLLFILMGAASILFLVTLVNVAALHLTRLARGRRENAVRAALGASRSQLIRPLFAEALVLSAIGGAIGIGGAWAGTRLLLAVGPEGIRRLAAISVDWRAAAVAVALALVAALLLALLPLRRASAGTSELGGRSVAGTRSSARGRRLVVGAQLALGLVLMIGAGLLVRSFALVLSADRGYRSDHVLSFSLWVYNEYPEAGARFEFVREVIDRLAALPGVQSASMGSALPLAEEITGEQADIFPEGAVLVPGEERIVRGTVVWPSYFATLGVPLKQGRTFALSDDGSGARVVVVNESFTRQFFPGVDPLGRTVHVGLMGRAIERTVVGVVADTRHVRLDAPPEPAVFIPWTQQPLGSLTFVLRTSVDPGSLGPSVTRALYEIDPRLAVARLATLDDLVDAATRERRFLMTLLAAFALAATLIATVGVFGVMSQSVNERVREVAVRMALGASPSAVVSGFLREAGTMTAAGLAAGLVVALLATRVLAGFLYGIAPIDAVSIVLAVLFIATLALFAATVPSWRAARTDPARVLQEE